VKGEEEINMKLICKAALLITLLILFVVAAVAEDKEDGEVTLPLNQYSELIKAVQNVPEPPRPVPAGYALGRAQVAVTVSEIEKRAFAEVKVDLSLKVLDDDWVLVPILPVGTSVSSAAVAGKSVELIATPEGLGWGTKNTGSYEMTLQYTVDAVRSENGYSLGVPLPAAAAITLSASLPGTGLDAVIIPSAGTRVSSEAQFTRLMATIPTASGVQISWRTPADLDYTISRAHYSGELRDDAVHITGEFNIELFNDETLKLKLLPQSVTLNDIRVDGEDSAILTEDSHFAALVKGRGRHEIAAQFQVPVVRDGGPPRIDLLIPRIPVSRIELRLPGKKEINVQPVSNVSYAADVDSTLATVYVPMTDKVSLSWNEAVPEEIKAELRANASIYHAVHAEEGALYVHALVKYEVTRGETNVIDLEVPREVQINNISAQGGGITDWRVVPGEAGVPDTVHVFLDQKLENEILLDISYDRSLVGKKSLQRIQVPLLKGQKLHRQRGMIALLASKELTLKPIEENEITRVGENQLPPFVRQKLDMKVVNTYKYVELSPSLIVQAATPERKQGKFDALVNTLISLSDVTMKGSASVEVNVKSGKISELQLILPVDVNFLSLTAPSLRTHKVQPEEGRQVVDVQFTQEMEGQFRMEVAYELIMADGQAKTKVPTLAVDGAEVEQGQIAVEALSAVEVKAVSTAQLSSLDTAQLPRQLILKTTNPILLAYKYVHVDPPYDLVLKITRHKEIEVESATIDQASYDTLYTRDGLAVTTANFLVRNSRKQFLRVRLPENSSVWSVYVNGQAEKPALADKGGADQKDEGPEVLIKIINSVQGFPVQLIYQTAASEVGAFGTITGTLPRPDMVVTRSVWNVYLPDDLSFGRPDTNMDIVREGVRVPRDEIRRMHADSTKTELSAGPLQINVPADGVLYSFEKLYANKAKDDAVFSIPYVAGVGATLSYLLVGLGAVLVWVGIILFIKRPYEASIRGAFWSVIVGAVILLITVGYYGTTFRPAVYMSVIVAAGLAINLVKNHRKQKA
jgi:hypothetical protein